MRFYCYIFSVLLTLFSFGSAFAGHIIGMDMSYRCLQDGDYEITLNIYKDAGPNTTGFDNGINFFILNADGTLQEADFTVFFNNSNVIDIPPDFGNENPCIVIPDNVNVQQGRVTFKLSDYYTGPTEGKRLIYQRCCRNSDIRNLEAERNNQGTTYPGSTSEIIFPENGDEICNSSPVWGNLPPPVICVNEPLVFDHSASDIDGDAIIYRLCAPYDGASPQAPVPNNADLPYEPVPYQTGYSEDYPIDADPAFRINPTTGELTGTPTRQGRYVIGICAEEYRNGELLGRFIRDFQFNVSTCPPPTALHNKPDGSFDPIEDADPVPDTVDYLICKGESYRFENIGNSGGGQANYKWEFGDSTIFTTTDFVNYTYEDTGTYFIDLMINPDLNNTDCQDTDRLVVLVREVLDVRFDTAGQNNSYDCEKMVINPIYTGKRGTKFRWFLDGNLIANTKELDPITFTEDGSYRLKLEVEDDKTCNLVGTFERIYKYDKSRVRANFDVPELAICESLTYQFVNKSVNGITYFWDFGVIPIDSDTSDTRNSTYTFPEFEAYEVTLYAYNPRKCNQVDSLKKTIVFDDDRVIADFEMIDDRNCERLIVNIDNTSQNVKTYKWYIDDSLIAESKTPTITITENGTYDLKVVAFNGEKCNLADSITRSIFYNKTDSLMAEADYDFTFDCDGLPEMTFVNSSTNDASSKFLWTFDDNNTTSTDYNTEHTFSDPNGTYQVVLLVSDSLRCNLKDSVVFDFEFDNGPITANASFNEINKCDSLVVNITNLSDNGVLHIWDYGDEIIDTIDNPIYHAYQDGGEYTLTLTAIDSFNCNVFDTFQYPISFIDDSVVARMSFNNIINCDSLLVKFSNNSYNGQYFIWDFGNGSSLEGNRENTLSPDIQLYPETGVVYPASLIAIDSAKCNVADTFFLDVDFRDDTIKAAFDFTMDRNCDSVVVTFRNASNDGFEFLWVFGDGDSAHTFGQTINHTYYVADTYDIVFTVIDSFNCFIKDSTVGQFIYDTTSTQSAFDWSLEQFNCDSMTIRTVENSYNGHDYYWIFDDSLSTSNRDSGQIAEHVFHTYDIYDVALITFDSTTCNQYDTAFIPIKFSGDSLQGNIEIDPNLKCSSLAVSFANNGDPGVSFAWNFGDGSPFVKESNPTHIFPDAGTYLITLIIENDDFCNKIDTVYDSITIRNGPITADFDVDTIRFDCQCMDIVLHNYSTNALNYVWDFGDGVQSTRDSGFIYQYCNGNEYTVTLLAIDSFNCNFADTAIKIVGYSQDSLQADFTFFKDINCDSLTVLFNDSSIYADSLNVTFDWTFDHPFPVSETSSDENPTYTYHDEGTYLVTLITTDSLMCNYSDTVTYPIFYSKDTMVGTFEPQFDPYLSCNELFVNFTESSTLVNRWIWLFGDGNIAQGNTDITNTYEVYGGYEVTLILQNDTLCRTSDTLTDSVYFYPPVTANFAADKVCSDVALNFNNLSYTNSNTRSYSWDFGDGTNVSSEAYPSHLFPGNGEYLVKFVVEELNSCNLKDSISKVVELFPVPMAEFSFTPDTAYLGFFTYYANLSSEGGVQTDYFWDFGDNSFSREINPEHAYANEDLIPLGQHFVNLNVCLKAENIFGCTDSLCKDLYMEATGVVVPNAFSPNGDGINDVLGVQGSGFVSFDLQIFNRWGQLIFQSDDKKKVWDGTFKGKVQESDSYTYILKAFLKPNNRAETFTGKIELFR